MGSFLHQLDPKGRVSLPAPFRRGREGEPFVLIQTQPDALSLYPDDGWTEVQEELRQMSKRQPGLRNQVLRVTAGAIEVVPDKQGRILIPEKMRGAVSLGTEALMVGAINHIEIWDPKRFEEETGPSDDAFEGYIERVFA